MRNSRWHLRHRVRNTEEYDGTTGGKSTLRKEGVKREDKDRQVSKEKSKADIPKQYLVAILITHISTPKPRCFTYTHTHKYTQLIC